MRNRIVHIVCLMIVFAVTSWIFSACNNGLSLNEVHSKTEEYFRDELQKNNVHNAFLSIYSPTKEIDWSFAGGHFADGKKVTASNPFFTASIGKTFTATAIAMLVEQQKLSFNDPISRYLPDSVMLNIHVLNGIDYSYQITIAHLLQHTSGLPDYFEDSTVDGSPNGLELLFSNPEKFWDATEIIEFAKTKMKPLFKPGTDYHYSDTEYVLLGLIIEKISHTALHDFFKEHFFIPLKMKDSYMLYRSQAIHQTAMLSEVFVGDNEV
nr:serine hydrolase domain-containing protein [uncultured Carboxylicivirga sp.]